jgi:hypothetical protein
MRRVLAALLLFCSCTILPPSGPIAIPGAVEDIFWDVADGLHREMPVEGRVCVELTDALPAQYLGLTWVDFLGTIQIRVRPQELQGLLDTLIHEWAHAAVIRSSQESSHDAFWGVAYARAYRIELAVLERRRKGEGPPAEATGEPSGTFQGVRRCPMIGAGSIRN